MDVITEFDQTVYKTDSAGKVRILHVYTEGADLIQESGLKDGKLVKHRSTATGKNIGKANETTPEEQAQLEAASKIETKRSTGYFDTEYEAKNNEVILPMLAKSYDKEVKKIDWKKAVYIQPKLDGMRCLAIVKDTKVTLMSRKGKVIDTMQHIIDVIEGLGLADCILDGELYAHGKTFQENMKLIKKYRQGETEDVVYHLYDRVIDKPYTSRYGGISLVVSALGNPAVELIECQKILQESDIAGFHSQYLSDGYEGSIIRHGDDGYKVNGRSSSLLKFKDFVDIACKVVDIVPSKRDPEQGVVHCEVPDGTKRTFGCGMKASHNERKDMLVNKANYIGKTAEIRFFEYSDDGIPRFPVYYGLRLDK